MEHDDEEKEEEQQRDRRGCDEDSFASDAVHVLSLLCMYHQPSG